MFSSCSNKSSANNEVRLLFPWRGHAAFLQRPAASRLRAPWHRARWPGNRGLETSTPGLHRTQLCHNEPGDLLLLLTQKFEHRIVRGIMLLSDVATGVVQQLLYDRMGHTGHSAE